MSLFKLFSKNEKPKEIDTRDLQFRLVKRTNRYGQSMYFVLEQKWHGHGGYRWHAVPESELGFSDLSAAERMYEKCIQMPNGFIEEVLEQK
jgi:hypothetical protein